MTDILPGTYVSQTALIPSWKLLPKAEDFIGTPATPECLAALQAARQCVLKAFQHEQHPFIKAAIWLRYVGLCSIASPPRSLFYP
jgi:hypothetical protein